MSGILISVPTLNLNLPGHAYAIHVDVGALGRLGDIARDVAPASAAMLIVDDAITGTHGAAAQAALESAGYDVTVATLHAEEADKSLAAAAGCYDAMLRARLERRSPVVAVGGGIIGDVGGFVAATYLRGVPLIQVPTTLLAMVDASIGGKTGVNFPLPDGGLGKNLVGAFWQPRSVVADPAVLATLDRRDYRAGLGECVKHAVIAGEELLGALEASIGVVNAREPGGLAEVVHRSAGVKCSVVADDEREQGRRAILNLGHTFAHAVETRREQDLRHGEAVSIGMVAALAVSRQRGWIDDALCTRVAQLLQAFDLPVRLKEEAPVDELVRTMAFDKKVAEGTIRLVLVRGLGDVVVVDDATDAELRAGWAAVMP